MIFIQCKDFKLWYFIYLNKLLFVNVLIQISYNISIQYNFKTFLQIGRFQNIYRVCYGHFVSQYKSSKRI